MSRETVLSNARIVLDQEVRHGSILIRNGLIAGIGSDSSVAGVDLGGDLLLPGLVELHTDHLERHFTPRPGVQWEPLPAVLASDAQLAAAGATTVLDAVRIGSASNQNDAAAEAARVLADSVEEAADAGLLRADHAIHVRCEVSAEDCLDAFSGFGDDPHVLLVSLMDHTTGQRRYADLEALPDRQGQRHRVRLRRLHRSHDRTVGALLRRPPPGDRGARVAARHHRGHPR
jgi:alpha-D-ribose 1-methylphosphonate 5-triphosphate diphosphatase